jgi:hypothetical protein
LLQKDVKIHKKTVTDLDAESKKIEENMKWLEKMKMWK